MKNLTVYNLSRPQTAAVQARYCASFFCRLRGLMFHRPLAAGQGLLLVQKRQNKSDAAIHMLFVGFDLAVVWIDAHRQVVDVKLARRWRLLYAPRAAAQYVLEMPASRLTDFQIGDRLRFDQAVID